MAELGRFVIPAARKEKHVGDGKENNSRERRKEGGKNGWETLTVVAGNRRVFLQKQSQTMRRHTGLRGRGQTRDAGEVGTVTAPGHKIQTERTKAERT